MGKIDSHQHFWKFDQARDGWITDDMAVIRRDFMPADLLPELDRLQIDGTVSVQADQSEEETQFLLSLAENNERIKGAVGWIDLQSDGIEERLSYYSQYKKLKGFRHILQGENQRDFMLRPAFLNGIGKLQAFGFAYDILIFPDQLAFTETFVKKFPDQRFVLDHLAKPLIRERKTEPWRSDIHRLARLENVMCKISGMVTEGNWKLWKKDDFTPYLDAVVTAFGTDRLMFGSDWPVCLVAASYTNMMGIVKDYFSSLSASEQEKIFGVNAERFYNL